MFDWIADWFKTILIEGIVGNLSGLFNAVNNEVSTVAAQVGQTPSGWDSNIFSMIYTLSQNVILPIAGIILTFVMCYELIQIIIEKNNMHDIDTWIFFKWIFKTFIAVLIVSNTWNIVMGIFDVAQSVVNSGAGLISTEAGIDISVAAADLAERLQEMGIGSLLGTWFSTLFVSLTVHILAICIFLIVYGRMIEIYLVTSLAPIPMATMANRDIGHIGQNYIRSILALAFQGFLMLVCIGIYAVLVKGISYGDDIVGAMWGCVGYTVLLCFALFKTGSLAKSIFGAH